MHFASMNEFVAMGGYGLYVWLSFGLGLLSVAILWLSSWSTKKRLFKQVLREQVRQQRIQQAKQQPVKP
ncbi:heme exporter protein CcmD [Paraglaciecola sp. 25GB23A]|uniref:heme exporter protein CcmD n=1 Tax=Paraglaciecola sp. 25GB23A TaxID=3156068 RepID=UPI0032AFD510|tara:strand:- start:524 stop:730 length:207 start_codon:yes stop_codon:yes gene_type:complete